MGVKEKRAKYKEEFRGEILEAARELFIDDGYEQFSMRKLANKIDYSPTTIYLYYKSKDDLLLAICEEFAEQFFTHLNHIRSLSNDPLDKLRHALLYLIEFGLNNPNQFKVFFFMKPNVYGTREEFMENESMARNTYLAFREMVRDCIKTGSLREIDVEVLTDALVLAPHGLIVMTIYNTSFPRADCKVVAETLIDGLLRGYQK